LRKHAICRLAARENRRALFATTDHPDLLDRMRLLRLDACLNKSTIAKIIRALDEAVVLAHEAHSPDNYQWISITALLLPLVK
jgi:hypothetical protein